MFDMNKLLCAVFITLFSLPCQAMTEYKSDLICPIGGEKFEAVLAGSGTSFGNYLDLKPYGPTPAPWPIAKCPSNGFVIFKNSFTPTEREKLKSFVETEQYQLLQKKYSNYYLAAKLKENLGVAKREIAHTLLQATW
ncbi:MAG: hypothetical protein KA902_03775, partial [Arenimonas sp.]|nr:hypothetical protein [Arenimonas sp.]